MSTKPLNMVESINRAFFEEMERDEAVIVLGEDVGLDGGIFRLTDGLLDKFGDKRVVDTPIAESAILGASMGLAIGGFRPVCEMQFSGFSYYAFHQMESQVSRIRRRTQGRFTAPLVMRMPYGAGVRALEHHSESREAYWAHTPGVKVVIPSTPRNARSILKASIRDPDPVVYMEPKALYRKYREEVPQDDEVAQLGKCHVAREGGDVTIVAYGHMLYRTMQQAVPQLEEEGVDAEVIDVQTISPLDSETIINSVKKTGRCVVVHEAPRTLGLGGEIVARINEDALDHLEAPVARVTGYDIHVPLLAREEWYMPDKARILEGVQRVLTYA